MYAPSVSRTVPSFSNMIALIGYFQYTIAENEITMSYFIYCKYLHDNCHVFYKFNVLRNSIHGCLLRNS